MDGLQETLWEGELTHRSGYCHADMIKEIFEFRPCTQLGLSGLLSPGDCQSISDCIENHDHAVDGPDEQRADGVRLSASRVLHGVISTQPHGVTR
jgi:hypothetical protein